MARLQNAILEGVELRFRNFRGAEGEYNRLGDRNFAVMLSNETAEQMDRDGWNVKMLKAREEGDEPQAYIPVAVSFKKRDPMIWLITSRGKTLLPEDLLEPLDYVDIKNVDLILYPYEWTVNGKSGVKAYLHSIYVTMHEDPLMLKYADVKQIGAGSNLAIESGDEWIEGEVIEDHQVLELEG